MYRSSSNRYFRIDQVNSIPFVSMSVRIDRRRRFRIDQVGLLRIGQGLTAVRQPSAITSHRSGAIDIEPIKPLGLRIDRGRQIFASITRAKHLHQSFQFDTSPNHLRSMRTSASPLTHQSMRNHENLDRVESSYPRSTRTSGEAITPELLLLRLKRAWPWPSSTKLWSRSGLGTTKIDNRQKHDGSEI